MVSRAGNRLGEVVGGGSVEITPDPAPQPAQPSALTDAEVPEHDMSLGHTAACPIFFLSGI